MVVVVMMMVTVGEMAVFPSSPRFTHDFVSLEPSSPPKIEHLNPKTANV